MARLPKLFDNSDTMNRLQSYIRVCDLPFGVEDVFSGVARANLANHGQQHSKSTLLLLLQTLPCISTQMIMEAFGYSSAHARNLAVACRTLSGLLQQLPSWEWLRPSSAEIKEMGISLWSV